LGAGGASRRCAPPERIGNTTSCAAGPLTPLCCVGAADQVTECHHDVTTEEPRGDLTFPSMARIHLCSWAPHVDQLRASYEALSGGSGRQRRIAADRNRRVL